MPSQYSPVPPAPFEIRDRVRWSHCDPMGIIWYGTYLRFIEAAEAEMFRACGFPFSERLGERGLMIPRKALELLFHSPAELDEEVLVQAWVERLGVSSLTMRFEIVRAADRTPRASALLTVVNVDVKLMKKQPLRDDVRQALSRYLFP